MHPRKEDELPMGRFFFFLLSLAFLVWIAFYALDGIAITESFLFYLSLKKRAAAAAAAAAAV